jgi:hypothetical protein
VPSQSTTKVKVPVPPWVVFSMTRGAVRRVLVNATVTPSSSMVTFCGPSWPIVLATLHD